MIGRLLNSRGGASAAEFAFSLPLLLLALFGIIDAGRFMWEYNQAEKATQMGARYGAVTDVVAGGLNTANFVGQTVTVGGVTRTLTQGDNIPKEALGTVTCTNTSCSCAGTCPAGIPGAYNSTSFTRIYNRVKVFKPDVTPANVVVEYRGSGLGFAGDPTGPDVAPLMTVRLTGMNFRPMTLLFRRSIAMPDFRATLSLEDGAGTIGH